MGNDEFGKSLKLVLSLSKGSMLYPMGNHAATPDREATKPGKEEENRRIEKPNGTHNIHDHTNQKGGSKCETSSC